MAMAKDLGAKVDGTVLMDIIRKTRAKSDIALHYPKFNPDGHVTGCNARGALSFYLQLTAKAPKFNPGFEFAAKEVAPTKAKGLPKKAANS